MLKAFSYLQKLLTIFVIGLILMQGVFSLNQITANAADGVATGNDNISSLNNCAVYLSGGVLQFKTAEVASRSGDVGPCVDDAGKLFYECTDTDVTHSGISNVTKASCQRSSSAPTTCYTLAGRLVGTGDRKLTINQTPECKIAFTETCANIWDQGGGGGASDQCKLLYNGIKPDIVVINSNDGTATLAKCNTNFTAQDDADLAKRNIKKDALGKYPVGTCKDDSGKLLICNSVQVDNKYVNCKAANEEAKGNNAVVQSKVDDKSLGNGLIGIFLGILSIILLVIFYILNWALSFLLWILGLVFINILVINPVSVEYIEVAKAPWQILVNIANLLTLASLIFVGIGYILNIKSLKIGIQQLLLNVTIFSLLLNFTLLGLQGVTTITQGLGDAMITARSGQPPAFLSGGQNILLDSVLTGIKGISLIRCGNQNLDGLAIKCQTGTTIKEKETATDANGFGEFGNLTTAIGKDTGDILAGKIGDKVLRAMMLEVVYTMVLIYAIITLFKGSMMVLIRLVAFWLLLIVSPLALAAYFMPVPSIKKYAGQWAEKTWQLAVFYPVAILLLILISEIVSQFSNAINKSIGGAATAATGTANLLNTVQVYAATGDFGGVFTAMVSTVLVGFIGVVAFGTMSTFMDKFLGPIAKALGDGIKSAASALGTAGYIGGSAIRMGAGAANKITGGAVKGLVNRSPVGKFLQSRADKAKQNTLQSGKEWREIMSRNKANLLTGTPLEDETAARNKFQNDRKALDKAKKFNDNYKNSKKFISGNAKKFSQNKFVQGTSKFASRASNKILDGMQFGISDVADRIELGGTLWKALGTKRKAEQAERKAQLRGRAEAGLIGMQDKSKAVGDLLAYSDLDTFNGKYVLGEKSTLTKEQIDQEIAKSGRQTREKVGGINRDISVGQARSFINKYRDKNVKDLSNIQQAVLRDIYEKAEKDQGFAESMSLLEQDQDFLAKNAYDSLDFATIKSLTKKAPQLLTNSKGLVGDEGSVDKDGKPRENVEANKKIKEELENVARSYANSLPESEVRKSMNAGGIASNPVMMEVIDEVAPSLAKELREKTKLNQDFNASYSRAETQEIAKGYSEIKEIIDKNGDKVKVPKKEILDRDNNPVEISSGLRDKMGAALVASGTARAEKGYGSMKQLKLALMDAGDDEDKLTQTYKEFYQNEYGISEVNAENLNKMSLKELESANLSKTAMGKLKGYGEMSTKQKEVFLRDNLTAAWKSFGRAEKSFKNTNQGIATGGNKLSASTANQTNAADQVVNIQEEIANFAAVNPQEVLKMKQNGQVAEMIEGLNSEQGRQGNSINLGDVGLIQYVVEEEQKKQRSAIEQILEPKIAEVQRYKTEYETKAQEYDTKVTNYQKQLDGFEQDIVDQTQQIQALQDQKVIQQQIIDSTIKPSNITDLQFSAQKQQAGVKLQNLSQSISTGQSKISRFQQQIQQTEKPTENNGGYTSAGLDKLKSEQKALEVKQAKIATITATDLDIKQIKAMAPAYLKDMGNLDGESSQAKIILGRVENVKSLGELSDLGKTESAKLQIATSDGTIISHKLAVVAPQVITASNNFDEMLDEKGIIEYNGTKFDTREDGKITAPVKTKFKEGKGAIMEKVIVGVKGDSNFKFTADDFNNAMNDPKNSDWAQTSLADALGQQFGLKREGNGFINDSTLIGADGKGKGMFTIDRLTSDGYIVNAQQVAEATRYGGNTGAGIISATSKAAEKALTEKKKILTNAAQGTAQNELVELAIAKL